MERWRWMVAAAIVVGLAALVAVLIRQDPNPTTTTIRATASTTTSTSPSTTAATTTSTTTAEQRQAEVEMILQELWFGWFDAIYNKDADALWEVVATAPRHDAGVAAMEGLDFVAAPTLDEIRIREVVILLDRADCLVVENSVDMTAFLGIVGDSTVNVLWPDQRYGWRFATDWTNAADRWLDDCDNLVRETTP
ncbi:MAG: hypothetical protein WD651_13905 [Acidimicrobiia bacterium]